MAKPFANAATRTSDLDPIEMDPNGVVTFESALGAKRTVPLLKVVDLPVEHACSCKSTTEETAGSICKLRSETTMPGISPVTSSVSEVQGTSVDRAGCHDPDLPAVAISSFRSAGRLAITVGVAARVMLLVVVMLSGTVMISGRAGATKHCWL